MRVMRNRLNIMRDGREQVITCGSHDTIAVFIVALIVAVCIMALPALSPAVDLPRTGQTTSYAAGDDGDIQAGVAWPSTRFTDNGNGTVADKLTGLMWLKDANCFGVVQTWDVALNFANTLNSGECGLSDGSVEGDWRLPNVNELESLINAEEGDTASWLNTQGFSNVQFLLYWSSSTHTTSYLTTYAWIVDMYYGFVYADVKAESGNYYVWPLRDRINTSATYLVYQDDSYGNNEIVLGTSTDSGATWATQRFTNNAGSSSTPSIAVSGSNIYIPWADNTYGNNEIVLKRSADGGSTWTLKRMTNNAGSSINPSVAVNGANIYLAWQDDSYGNNEIVLGTSTDGGATWSLQRITNNAGLSANPSIAVIGNDLHIAWQDDSYGNNEIVLGTSNDSGATWTSQRITNNAGNSANPSITVIGSELHIAWQDDSYGNNEIVLGTSNDSGATWTNQRITNNTGNSVVPVITK